MTAIIVTAIICTTVIILAFTGRKGIPGPPGPAGPPGRATGVIPPYTMTTTNPGDVRRIG